eukprot:214057_1
MLRIRSNIKSNTDRFTLLRTIPMLERRVRDNYSVEVYIKTHKKKFYEEPTKPPTGMCIKRISSVHRKKPKQIKKYIMKIQCRIKREFCSEVLEKENPGARNFVGMHVSETDINEMEHLENVAMFMNVIEMVVKKEIKNMKKKK